MSITEVIIWAVITVCAFIGVAYALELLPNQWRCMYDDEPDLERCDRQCYMCRNMENDQWS